MARSIDACIRELIVHKVVDPAELRPCSSAEVQEVRNVWQRPLPAVYRRFLERMGRGAGKFLAGTQCFYPDILDLRPDVLELVAESRGSLMLPDDAFVFSLHGGYEFEYFLPGDSNDPRVYQGVEGQPGIAYEWPSLTAYFCERTDEYTT